MEHLPCLSSSSPTSLLRLPETAPRFIGSPISCPSASRPNLSVSCRGRFGGGGGDAPLDSSSARGVLGVEPSCSAAELKAAFRAKVKQYHPDVNRDGDSDAMIRLVIQAYEGVHTHASKQPLMLSRLLHLEELLVQLPKDMVMTIRCKLLLVSAPEIAFTM